MKHVKNFFLYIMIFVVFVEISLNLLINLNKKKLEKILPIGSKINLVIYIFPNYIFIDNINISSENYSINTKNVFLKFSIIDFIENNFVINSLNVKNVYVNILALQPDVGALEENTSDFIRNRLEKYLKVIPTRSKLSNININYKNYFIEIQKIVRVYDKKLNIDSIQMYGVWNNVPFSINALLKNRIWSLNGKFSTSNFLFGVNNLEFMLYGDYSLYNSKNYVLTFVTPKNKYAVSGNINFNPLEIKSILDFNFAKGDLLLSFKDGVYSFNYNGIFNLKLPKFISNQVDFNNSKTFISLNFSKDEYFVEAKMFKPDFQFKFKLVNKIGEGFLNFNESQKIPFKLVYDESKKLLLVYNTQNKYKIDCRIDFSKDNIYYGYFKVLNFLSDITIKRNKNILSIDSNSYIDFNKINIEFSTNFSTGSLKVGYISRNNVSSVFFDSYFNISSKNSIFLLKCKNIFNTYSFVVEGDLRRVKSEFLIESSVKDFYFLKNKVFSLGKLSGKFVNNLLNLVLYDKNKTFLSKLKYDLKENVADLDLVANNKYISLDKLGFTASCTLNFLYSQDKLNFEGYYEIYNISYDSKKVFFDTKGNISSDKEILFSGQLFYNKNLITKYNLCYNYKKSQLYINLKDVNLISIQNKNLSFFDVELYAKINKNLLEEPILFYGRIRKDNSELEISSSTFKFNTGEIKVASKIRNFNFINNSIFSDLYINIKNINLSNTDIDLKVKNIWLNDEYYESFVMNCLYDKLTKKLIFYSNENANLNVSGTISFLGKSVIFEGFKIHDKIENYIVCNGKVGSQNDTLRLQLSKIPFSLVGNFLRLPLRGLKGNLYSNTNIVTISSDKKIYQINSNFIVSSLELDTIKLEKITGKFLINERYISFENVDVFFQPNQKISLKGDYSLVSDDINILINSDKCDISFLSGYHGLIKKALGEFSVNLKIIGKKNFPKLQGYFVLQKGILEFNEYLEYLKDLNMKITFFNRDIKLENFYSSYKNTALVGSGEYNLSGLYSFIIKTKGGDGIYTRLPELSFPVGQFFKLVKGEQFFPSNGYIHLDINLSKKYKDKLPFIFGKITMNNTHFTYPGVYTKGQFLESNFYHNIDIVAGNNVWYENEYLSTNISGKLNFKYLEDMPKIDINGEAISLRGKVNFLNTNFDINYGRLEILNRVVYIELKGSTDIVTAEKEKIPVNLIIERSKIDDIKPKLISPLYPDLTTEEITSLLLGVGKVYKSYDKIDIISSEKIDYLSTLRSHFVKIIDNTFATPIAKNILQKWGIADNFSVENVSNSSLAQTKSEQNNETTQAGIRVVDIFKDTKYVMEKYLSPDLMLSYSIALAEIQNKLNLKHELEISYRLGSNLFIKGIYNYDIRDENTQRYSPNVGVVIQPIFKLKTWEEEKDE
ncbi:MAG: translocation/assembly module TamB [Endomicrobia bacterium]|nr:translocation/assembly module TamB [Endomicrobiia bacterium]